LTVGNLRSFLDLTSVQCFVLWNTMGITVWCLRSSTMWHRVTGWMVSNVVGPPLPQNTGHNSPSDTSQ
jgi:hypothetical protein